MPQQPLQNLAVIIAQDIRQLSHMELLCEGARPEPRLRRVLGHASAYESASRWCQENKRQSVCYVADVKEKARERRPVVDGGHQNGVSMQCAAQVQHFLTLSEFQVVVQSQLQHRQLVTVNATEIDGDSDDSDSSYSSGDDDDDDDDNDNNNDAMFRSFRRNLDIQPVDYLTKGLLLKDGDNNIEVMEFSTCRSAKEEQSDGSPLEEQGRVLTDSESQLALYDLRL